MGVCQSNPESDTLRKNSGGATGKNGAANDLMVKVQALTWMRDSHGLFDYESTQTIQQTIKLRGQDHTLFRNNGEVAALENDKDELPLPLGHVTLHEAGYWLQPANMRILGRSGESKKLTMGLPEVYDDEESMWIVARHLNHVSDRGYRIQKGDYIKFGRVRYRVKEMNNATSVESSPKLAKSLSQYGAFKIQDKLLMDASPERSPQVGHDIPQNDVRSCRICLSDVIEDMNPLVSPCDCSGTMKHVHIKCLQQWLTNKTQCRVQGSVTSVAWKNMNCELCRKDLPESCQADSDGKEHDLIELPRPDPSTNTPYIMLEVLSREKKNGGKGLQILEFSSKPSIKVGRGQDCDLRVPDISVSRFHALIRYDAGEGEFYLVDNNSKFGTLILVQRPIPLKEEFRKVTVQVGRSIFSVSLEKVDKKWASFTTACMNAISIEKDDSLPGGQKKRDNVPTVMSGSHLSASHQPMVMSLPQSPNLREDNDDNEGIPDEHYDVPRSGSQYGLMHNSQ